MRQEGAKTAALNYIVELAEEDCTEVLLLLKFLCAREPCSQTAFRLATEVLREVLKMPNATLLWDERSLEARKAVPFTPLTERECKKLFQDVRMWASNRNRPVGLSVGPPYRFR